MSYFERLRREAQDFFFGHEATRGELLYGEIERVVAQRLVHRYSLPPIDHPSWRLLQPAGFGPDPFSPESGWDLLHDFTVEYLLDPGDPKIFVAFQRATDLDGFRHWMRVLLGRYLHALINAHESRGVLDSVLEGLTSRFLREGLVRHAVAGDAYWSQRRLSAEELLAVSGVIQVEPCLDAALQQLYHEVRPCQGDDRRRSTEGYGSRARDLIASILIARLSASVPGLGTVSLIPERPLRARLARLVEAQIPELFTEPLYLPSRKEGGEGEMEEREAPGVQREYPSDLRGSTEAVLEIMERLVMETGPVRPGATSGCDVRHAMRLYFSGARSSHEAKRLWALQPVERRGKRPLTMASAMECMPGGAAVQAQDARVVRRLEALLEAFHHMGDSSRPRSHVTIQKLRDAFWSAWSTAIEGLDEASVRAASRWLVDLLFMEIGRYAPDPSTAASLAAQDAQAAREASHAAMRAIHRLARRDGFDEVLSALDSASADSGHEVAPPHTSGDRARLQYAGRRAIERAWDRLELLPCQRVEAEALLAAAIREEVRSVGSGASE